MSAPMNIPRDAPLDVSIDDRIGAPIVAPIDPSVNPSVDTANDQTDPESYGPKEVFDNLINGASLGAAFGLEERELEAVYALALNQYQQGRYADAIRLFAFITFHDPSNMKAFKGLGSSLQMLGRFREALIFLGMAIVDDDSDMQIAVQVAECLLHIGQRENAIALLKRIEREIDRHGGTDYTQRKVTGLMALMAAAPSAAAAPVHQH